MKYDFDKIVIRDNTYSAKFEELEEKFGKTDLIPMWIADMDFLNAKEIEDAVVERAKHSIYGYTARPEKYFNAVKEWQKYKNNWDVDTKYMSHAAGVLPMLANIFHAFSQKGDKVIIQPPVFSEFKKVITNWGLEAVDNPLIEENNYYSIDFDDLKKKAKDAKFMIFCSPHNPVGRVWTKEEIEKVAKICLENDVLMISDEMYSDITLFGNKHIPTASISEEIAKNTITCTSLGKTFNIPGLKVATCILPSLESKEKYDKILEKLEMKRSDCFSIIANQVAMYEGREWFNQLIEYLEDNIKFAEEYIKTNIPKIKFAKAEATYLLWLDCRELNLSQEDLVDFFVNEAKLALNDGSTFGDEGIGYMRMNLGCPRSVIEKALSQLKEAVNKKVCLELV